MFSFEKKMFKNTLCFHNSNQPGMDSELFCPTHKVTGTMYGVDTNFIKPGPSAET